jgi:hypothetical protein
VPAQCRQHQAAARDVPESQAQEETMLAARCRNSGANCRSWTSGQSTPFRAAQGLWGCSSVGIHEATKQFRLSSLAVQDSCAGAIMCTAARSRPADVLACAGVSAICPYVLHPGRLKRAVSIRGHAGAQTRVWCETEPTT